MVAIYFLFTRGNPCLYSYLFSLPQFSAQFSYLVFTIFSSPVHGDQTHFMGGTVFHMALKLVRII